MLRASPFVTSAALALTVLVQASQAGPARAQPRASATPTPEVLPPAGQGTQTGGASGPANGDGKEPPKSTGAGPAGYAYSDKTTRSTSSGPGHAHYRRTGPVVNIPGFEQTADGGSRLFVQLTQGVPVEERRAQGTITYVLKGASPRVWNNTNALVTVHFNTPVYRARLVPHGADLHFIIELRAAATPTYKVTDNPDKTAILTIDFPKGDYQGAAIPVAADGAAVRETPPTRARGAQKTRPAAPRGAAPAKAQPAGPKP